MGDRCHLTMTIHAADLAKAIEQNPNVRDLDEFELDRIEYEMEEVNYAATEGRETLAGAGVRFYGSHSSGGEYPGFDFYSDGKILHEWPTNDHGGYAINIAHGVIAAAGGLTLNLDEIAKCEEFCTARWAMRKLIDDAAKAWSPPSDPWDELDQEALDEMVHEAWSQGASQINNEGRAKQVAWLKSRGIAP